MPNFNQMSHAEQTAFQHGWENGNALEDAWSCGWQEAYNEGAPYVADYYLDARLQDAYSAGYEKGDRDREAANARAEARLGC
jgi:hypothetical protein